eukprot:scaffold17342_cov130-Isochrysis_galbana.AAC.9
MGQSRGEWVVVWGLGDRCAATTIYPAFRYTHVGAHLRTGWRPVVSPGALRRLSSVRARTM